jgi:hypothetical protein
MGISSPGEAGPSYVKKNIETFTVSTQNDVDHAAMSSSESVNIDCVIPHLDPQNAYLRKSLFTFVPTEKIPQGCDPQMVFPHSIIVTDQERGIPHCIVNKPLKSCGYRAA